MAARLAALLPRLVVLTLIWLLATSTLTFAASSRQLAAVVEPKTAAPVRQLLLVPDVRGQAYVFAKSMLEDGGFAWKVEGSVEGYAANRVVVQEPAPDTRVVDTGAPTVTLRLTRGEYEQSGLPENTSPYPGTKLVLADKPASAQPASSKRREEPKAPAPKRQQAGKQSLSTASKRRQPDFIVAGAPPEPSDEMPLPDRARLLARRLAAIDKPSKAMVSFWLYQHAWIVTGAKFGWSNGAEALAILIEVDRDLQARFGFGGQSEAVAQAALAEVKRKVS